MQLTSLNSLKVVLQIERGSPPNLLMLGLEVTKNTLKGFAVELKRLVHRDVIHVDK